MLVGCGILCGLAINPSDIKIDEAAIWLNNFLANVVYHLLFIKKINTYALIISDLLVFCNSAQRKRLVNISNWFGIYFIGVFASQFLITPCFLIATGDTQFRGLYSIFNDDQARIIVIIMHFTYDIYVYGVFSFALLLYAFVNIIIESVNDNLLRQIHSTVQSIIAVRSTHELINELNYKKRTNLTPLGQFSRFNHQQFIEYHGLITGVKKKARESIEIIATIFFGEFFFDTILRLTFTATNHSAQKLMALSYYWVCYVAITIFGTCLTIVVDRIQNKDVQMTRELIDMISMLEVKNIREYDKKRFLILKITDGTLEPPTGLGFFVVNKRLMLNLISSTITFTVILLSLLEEKRNQVKLN